ncbi:acyl-CoA dehydrogenase family protein [Aquimarina sp. 2201CG14-23]|uniref:acyl-CoA dehydrogenase family protein n=1 Tax=Aquimarina mycalae TaxID=3040073 RepID=UPI002477F90D|nr:acyl-CoA dehydrogenase family protein [Aquimarina sp. 2201CG14-23]MDH7447454.1 acyl-CoA dehydrogenase family protein [Aquimarina sp. 2201CG14-23]
MEPKLETIKGGEFLIKTSNPNTVFTPEDYTEEHHMLREAIRDFLNKEIEPLKEVFDSKKGTEIAPEILEKLGELGFLAISVPESIGGMGCDIKTDLVASEIMSDSFSFSQTLGVQRGLGVNTILFYGTAPQKTKYLDNILSGKLKCSYCLTEPGAGSDANSGKTKATISEDGTHYILNGQKMWITNAGFADVFSVFCKIEDDENLSCLIVEKEWGVMLGAEENKLGIHGSSTRQVFFENVKVPVENLLGERNKGFKIAMNALNMGRLMIGVAGSAIAKRGFKLGVQYANQRIQFNKPIASFGAIQEKIAKMATDIYAIESGWNRLGGDMDTLYDEFRAEGLDPLLAKQKVAQEFATECAIVKVFGSEVEQYVIDEALQIHGGMGFSGESEISMHYRNIRGNRIYEGTNEINRLVIPGTILKYALKGKLPLMESAMQAFQDLQSGNLKPADSNKPFGEYAFEFLENCKKSALLISGQAMQKFQQDIQEEQEVLSRLADIISQIYILEGVILRTLKSKEQHQSVREAISSNCMNNAADLIRVAAKEVIFAASEGDMRLMSLKAIHKLLQLPARNIIMDRRTIATHFIQENQYKI